MSFRKIQDLQNDLSNYSQNLAKAEESYHKLKQDKDRELQDTVKQYDEKILKLSDQNQELVRDVDYVSFVLHTYMKNLAISVALY